MAGKAGRSGRKKAGSKALSFGVTAGAGPAAGRLPPVPRRIVCGLGEAGCAFARDMWQGYDRWRPEQETLLRECGVTVDALAEYAATLKGGRTVTGPRGALGPHPAVRLQSHAQRTLLLLLRALDLKEGA